jgi:hypothetical protein
VLLTLATALAAALEIAGIVYSISQWHLPLP